VITEKQINALWNVLREHMEPAFTAHVGYYSYLDHVTGKRVMTEEQERQWRAVEAEADANNASLLRRALEAAQLAAGPQVAVVQQTGDCTCAASGLLETNDAHEPHCGLQLIGMANFEDAAVHMGWLRPRRVWWDEDTVPAGALATDSDGVQAFYERAEAYESWTNHMGTIVETLTEEEWEAAVQRAAAERYQKGNRT